MNNRPTLKKDESIKAEKEGEQFELNLAGPT